MPDPAGQSEGQLRQHAERALKDAFERVMWPGKPGEHRWIAHGLDAYHAANLREALRLVPDTGDWHGSLRAACNIVLAEHPEQKPNQTAEQMVERAVKLVDALAAAVSPVGVEGEDGQSDRELLAAALADARSLCALVEVSAENAANAKTVRRLVVELGYKIDGVLAASPSSPTGPTEREADLQEAVMRERAEVERLQVERDNAMASDAPEIVQELRALRAARDAAEATGKELRDECEKRGLPVGLTGLLRHVEGNAALTAEFNKLAAEAQRDRLAVALRGMMAATFPNGVPPDDQLTDAEAEALSVLDRETPDGP